MSDDNDELAGFVAAVGAVIFSGNKLLAMRRSASKDFGAGEWETVSGRLRPGEQPLDGLAREVREETGLVVDIDPRPVDAYVVMRRQHPMLIVYYRANAAEPDVHLSDEHDRFDWLTPEEFAQRTSLTFLAEIVHRVAAIEGRPRADS